MLVQPEILPAPGGRVIKKGDLARGFARNIVVSHAHGAHKIVFDDRVSGIPVAEIGGGADQVENKWRAPAQMLLHAAEGLLQTCGIRYVVQAFENGVSSVEFLVEREIPDVGDGKGNSRRIPAGMPDHLRGSVHTGNLKTAVQHLFRELAGAAADVEHGRAGVQPGEQQLLEHGPRGFAVIDAPEPVIKVGERVVFTIAPDSTGA